jgi:hypothetical protein
MHWNPSAIVALLLVANTSAPAAAQAGKRSREVPTLCRRPGSRAKIPGGLLPRSQWPRVVLSRDTTAPTVGRGVITTGWAFSQRTRDPLGFAICSGAPYHDDKGV